MNALFLPRCIVRNAVLAIVKPSVCPSVHLFVLQTCEFCSGHILIPYEKPIHLEELLVGTSLIS